MPGLPANIAAIVLAGKLPLPPIAELIGFQIVEVELGRVLIEMQAGAQIFYRKEK